MQPAEEGLSFRQWFAHERRLVGLAARETREELQSRTKELLVAVFSAVLGAIIGAEGGVVSAIGSGLVGLVAACLLVFFWNLATIPAREHERLQEKVRSLTPPDSSARGSVLAAAILGLSEAFREVQLVAADEADGDRRWERLGLAVDGYARACAHFSPSSRRFHEPRIQEIRAFVGRKAVDRLLGPVGEVTDILFHGDLDLEVDIREPEIVIATNIEVPRGRFLVLSATVVNREASPVSLMPSLSILIEPGRMHMLYRADAEPVAAWNELLPKLPIRPGPTFGVPLNVDSNRAERGAWWFFLDGSLDGLRLDEARIRWLEAVLTVEDLLSQRRTQSEKIRVGTFLRKYFLV